VWRNREDQAVMLRVNQDYKENTMANQEEQNKQMQQIIAKCWSDEAFKEKLVADPHATLAAEGVHIPTAKLNSKIIQA
jgi:hypothetical protein